MVENTENTENIENTEKWKNKAHPDSRRRWDAIEQAAAAVKLWPAWMRGETETVGSNSMLTGNEKIVD